MIEFEIPSQFMLKVLSGEYIRYGGIIKDASTGQIIGHLKEVGSLGSQLSNLAINPASAVSQIGQFGQLSQIQSTLEGIQLISSVGALASVAILGVSIAGFASINNKLKKLESKLDSILGELSQIREIVQRSELKIDALTYSKLRAAIEEVYLAERASKAKETRRYARSASEKFRQIKFYYLKLLENDKIWDDYEIPLNEVRDLHSRFIVAILGELYSLFLAEDIGVYRRSLEMNIELVQRTCHFDKKQAYRTRVHRGYNCDTKILARQIKENHSIVLENISRIETMNIEASYIENNNLSPIQYINELKNLEPNLILLPSS